jgi:hypothetical protein
MSNTVAKSSKYMTLLHHSSSIFFSSVSWGGVRLSPLGTSATNWPIVPAPDDDECGAVGGIRIGRGNRSTHRKPTPVPLCPPQIPHDLTWARIQAAARKPATNRLSYGTASPSILRRLLAKSGKNDYVILRRLALPPSLVRHRPNVLSIFKLSYSSYAYRRTEAIGPRLWRS